ncbi:hypothetical protein Tco_0972509 [Tanacetum coccineum]
MDLASYKRLSVDSCNNHIKWDKKYGINDANLIPEHPSFRARGRSMLGGDRRSFRDYPDEVGPSRSEGTSTSEHHRNRRRSTIITPEIDDDIVRLHGWLMDNLRIMMAEEHASKEGTSKEGTSGMADGVRKYQVSKTTTNVGDGTDANEFSEGIAAAEEGEKNHSYFVKMDERIRAQCNAKWAPCTNDLVSPVDINPINSSADEEGGTTVVGCENKTAPKLQTKRKGVNYVSSDAM